jgi:hypothetical protein
LTGAAATRFGHFTIVTQLEVSDTEISLVSPPTTANTPVVVQVSVITPSGEIQAGAFEYT